MSDINLSINENHEKEIFSLNQFQLKGQWAVAYQMEYQQLIFINNHNILYLIPLQRPLNKCLCLPLKDP